MAKAAINEGFDATHIPSYGPESRGGTSYADVHVARDEVLSPAAPRPHALVAFNAPSLAKFADCVREGGTIIYDSSVISGPPPAPPRRARASRSLRRDRARSLGTVVVKNVVALGALQQATDLLADEALLTALRRSLKSKCAMIPVNEEAYRWGAKAVSEEITHFED